MLKYVLFHVIFMRMGNQVQAATLFYGGANPPIEERRALRMVTYSDLLQFGTFIVALISLFYQIFKDKRK